MALHIVFGCIFILMAVGAFISTREKPLVSQKVELNEYDTVDDRLMLGGPGFPVSRPGVQA